MTGRTISHYELQDKLGEGGMGIFFYNQIDHDGTEILMVENFH